MTPPHPRRSSKTTSSSPMTPGSATSATASASMLDTISMTLHKLRKGATFHNPSSPASDHFIVPCLPRRSQTSLEDVVEAHKRRVALTLGDIDRGLSAIDLGAPTPNTQNFRDDSLPVPQGFLNHTVDTNRRETRSTMSPIASQSDFSIGRGSLRPRRHNRRQSTHHASDSGLGSSIMSASSEKRGVAAAGGLTCLTDQQGAKSTVSASAITRSAAPHRSSQYTQPRLSERATNKTYEFILKPLLAMPSLKDFHPIVADCPRRINEKEIVCLRDLEKTLMFMAPEHSRTAKLYLEFCVTSIRCIQATVEFLNEREQTRPNDRPYTSGYFIDLVDQISNYAQSVQASREKEEEETDDMDVQPSEQIKLYGGVAKNGRPAELVRVKKDGTAISLATGKQIKMESIEDDEKNGVMMKRSLSQELDDEESIMRSMARRKRSATAEIQAKKCSEPGCTKEFKRSCDLTKHEKTHSRPWKCQEPLCKYHEYGWPTEKELDRHVNDKHSASPRLFKCQFPPCPYQSKRESNCKQHMEKSHNWVYVRSKNNGKNRDQAPAQQQNALPTPQTTTIRTPDSEAQLSSPDQMNWEMDAGNDANGFDDGFNHSPLDFPSYPSDFAYNNANAEQSLHNSYTLSPVDSHLNSLPSSNTSPYVDTSDLFLDDVTANFGSAFAPSGNDFTLYEDLYSARVTVPQQLPTPDPAIFQRDYDPSYACVDAVTPARAQGVQHLSPVGQGNTMLYTPDSSCETFEALMPGRQHAENHNNMGTQFSDFQLFGSGAPQGQGALFGEVAPLGGHQHEGGNTASHEIFMAFYGAGGAGPAEWGGDEGFDGKWGGL
ncbi:hypothetical protein GMDG_05092 [Pseudogymnoascus destructans 20631-21]|uniref:C2H2-type domain-containing protein n=1 Tax=Pseudogymnoascus destructans (strain ATCC MYA-4855 / 20631-21) TaxID=658429 RepID=L8FMZ5_PSED2|nr:hypothetical protein GMDG_05092 [Pseudogymnoascus destructans 20631-21]